MASRKSISHQDSTVYEEKVTQKGEHYFHPYYVGRLLGRGGFASCYEVKAANDTARYAIKIIPKDDDPQKRMEAIAKIREEVVIMKSLNHPGIVKYYNDFQDNRNFYIIMELCSGGSLSDIMKNRKTLSEPELRYFAVQMADIMQYLKGKQIIHRDIKLANYFLDHQNRLKLGDFGLATENSNSCKSRRRFCGTPNYIAPEMVQRKFYGFEVDAWSTGVLLFAMLFGKPPFQTKNCKDTYEKIKACSYEFPKGGCSEEVKDFIKRLLCPSPIDRLKFQEFMDHPFIYNFKIAKQLEVSFAVTQPSKTFIKNHSKAIRSKKIEVDVQPIAVATPHKAIAKTLPKQMQPATKSQRRVSYRNALRNGSDKLKPATYLQINDAEPAVKIEENICKQEDQQPALQLEVVKKQECLAELPQVPIAQCDKSVQKKEEPQYERGDDHGSSTNIHGRKKFQPNNPPADIERTEKKVKKEEKLVLLAAAEQKKDDGWVRPKLKFKIRSATPTIEDKQVRILYWQQCSKQLGIAYVLSNHEIGLVFQDSSCMQISKDSIIHHIFREGDDIKHKQIKVTEVQLQRESDEHVFAKAKILLHHNRILRDKYPFKEDKAEATVSSTTESTSPRPQLWVKSANKGDGIVAFTLSNSNIQFEFNDGTNMFFSLSSYALAYRTPTHVTVHAIPLQSNNLQGEFGDKVRVVCSHYNKVLNLRSGEGSERWLLQQQKQKQPTRKKAA